MQHREAKKTYFMQPVQLPTPNKVSELNKSLKEHLKQTPSFIYSFIDLSYLFNKICFERLVALRSHP